MKLYHGSRNKELKKFDFEYDSSSTFDFGKGIYFTSNFERAKAWSCHENGEGAVYEIDIDFTSADLNKKIFSKDEDDIYYVLYICRLGMSELAPEFVDDFEKYDVVVGPVLRGKKNASMDRYKDMAERFNEGDIAFNEFRNNTCLSNEDFDQWCFKSRKAFEYINANLTKKYVIKKCYNICEVIDL